jgi:hypothetical protein
MHLVEQIRALRPSPQPRLATLVPYARLLLRALGRLPPVAATAHRGLSFHTTEVY